MVRSRTPSAQLKTLQKIANSAARLRKNLEPGFTTRARVDANLQTLLRHLTIKSREAAEDGPGDPEILHLLAFAEGSTEDHVLDVIRTIVDGALEQRKRAAAELERLAREAGPRVRRVGELTVPLGNRGEWEVNDWLGKMLSLYPDLTGRSPGTSIGGPESDNKGQAYGPLIRFLIAAGRPVGLSYTPQAWRARVRALLAEAALQK